MTRKSDFALWRINSLKNHQINFRKDQQLTRLTRIKKSIYSSPVEFLETCRFVFNNKDVENWLASNAKGIRDKRLLQLHTHSQKSKPAGHAGSTSEVWQFKKQNGDNVRYSECHSKPFLVCVYVDCTTCLPPLKWRSTPAATALCIFLGSPTYSVCELQCEYCVLWWQNDERGVTCGICVYVVPGRVCVVRWS
jgi:hypothetical protein